MKKAKFDRNLTLLFSGQFVSRIGDKFYSLALAMWVLQATGSPARMGLMLFAAMAPSILLGFVLGGVLDRWNRKAILIVSDIARGAVVLIVAGLYFSGGLTFGFLLAAQAMLSAASAFFNPTVTAMLPSLAEGERLLRANATGQMIGGAADILGPALGGIAVAMWGYPFAFLFDALSFLLCAALNVGIHLKGAAEPRKERRALSALTGTYRFLLGNARLKRILGVVALVHLFAGLISVMTPVLANALTGDGAQNLGGLEAALGAGTVLCAALLRLLDTRGREKKFLRFGIGGIGLAMAAAGMIRIAGVGALWPYLATLPVLSASIVAVAVSYTVIAQKAVTNDVAGGVFSVMGSVGNLTLPLSMLLYGFLLERTDVGLVALISGAAVVLMLILSILFSSVRRHHLRAIRGVEG
jgi:MFS family permease